MNPQKKTKQSEDPLLKELQDEYEEEEETGPKISDQLAKIVNTMALGHKVSEDKLKDRMDKHKRPENCTLQVPRVNPEIWSLMDHATKSADLKAQKNQKKLVKVTFALAKVCDNFVKEPNAKTKDTYCCSHTREINSLSIHRGKLSHCCCDYHKKTDVFLIDILLSFHDISVVFKIDLSKWLYVFEIKM